jgi:hypothetical protein
MYTDRKVPGATVALLSLDFKLMNLLWKDTEICISTVLFRALHKAHYKISPNRTNRLQTFIIGISQRQYSILWEDTHLIMLDVHWWMINYFFGLIL